MPRPERIEDLIAEARGLDTEAAFVARFPHPFLVREQTRGPAGAPVPGGGERATLRVAKAAVPTGDDFAGGDVWVVRVCPADPENHDGAVTVGRDAGCDLVLDDASISGQHASFSLELREPDPDDDEDDGRTFLLTDVGSANGTWVDGDQAPAGKAVVLADQCSLRLGPAAKFQFFKAPAFFQFLDFYRRIKRKPK